MWCGSNDQRATYSHDEIDGYPCLVKGNLVMDLDVRVGGVCSRERRKNRKTLDSLPLVRGSPGQSENKRWKTAVPENRDTKQCLVSVHARNQLRGVYLTDGGEVPRSSIGRRMRPLRA